MSLQHHDELERLKQYSCSVKVFSAGTQLELSFSSHELVEVAHSV